MRDGGTFISERRARIARIVSITASMAASSAGNDNASEYSGHALVIMKSPSCGSA